MDVPVITLEKLFEYEPCNEEYTKVSAAFPDGIPLTQASMDTLLDLDIELSWAADYMLSSYAREKFCIAEKPHFDAHLDAIDAAWTKFDSACLGDGPERNTKLSEAILERHAAHQAARAAYNAAIAGPLLEAFLDDYNNNRGVFFPEEK